MRICTYFMSISFGLSLCLQAQASPGDAGSKHSETGEYSVNQIIISAPPRGHVVASENGLAPMPISYTRTYSLPASHESLFQNLRHPIGTIDQCMETMRQRDVCKNRTIREEGIRDICAADPRPFLPSCTKSVSELYPRVSCVEIASKCQQQTSEFPSCVAKAQEGLDLQPNQVLTFCLDSAAGLTDLRELVSDQKIEASLLLGLGANNLAQLNRCVKVGIRSNNQNSTQVINDCYSKITGSRNLLIQPPVPAPSQAATPVDSGSRAAPGPNFANHPGHQDDHGARAPRRPGPPKPRVVLIYRGQRDTNFQERPSDEVLLKGIMNGITQREMEIRRLQNQSPDIYPSVVVQLNCPANVDTSQCSKYSDITKSFSFNCKLASAETAQVAIVLITARTASGVQYDAVIERTNAHMEPVEFSRKLMRNLQTSGICK